ncbi:MAG: TVP38/TMEM64 family protein [Alphaproteobacteria bacterium]|nr:TVP38/TMEM64 family protein [Alphaproteobacteria bacterium]
MRDWTRQRWQAWAKAFAPLAVLLAALAAFFALGLNEHVSLESLRAQHEALRGWTEAHPILAVIVFLSVCAGLMAIAFPSVGVLMITGGYLFGYPGAVWTVLGASIGGLIFFLAARSAAGAALRARFAAPIARLQNGFRRNAFAYLLSLRFMPVMPFVITSTAGAAAGMRAAHFFAATVLGTLPAAFVYGSIGVGARTVFESGGQVSMGAVMAQPHMLAAIAGMAGLSAAAYLFRRRDA